ncbi:hypothetical protein [Salinisphaera sp. Q1T1-3]|uniref:hypothetical protein n=1 Tax=Salinisphaera sp. Q1T1-3 TaxID=2321229 RepID=UPI000E74B6D0|nr:hypothetical protein [Salinisphaera sp. Q1T1-3]RJS94878.1 hypothetical protein D3260_03725 [Salinisphaera sp. Q1T1-3]
MKLLNHEIDQWTMIEPSSMADYPSSLLGGPLRMNIVIRRVVRRLVSLELSTDGASMRPRRRAISAWLKPN